MALGHYPLRLPSYRSSHGRRYHPYPAVRRRKVNDENYTDPIPDFDFEAAEHRVGSLPSLQLRPTRPDDDDDDDVTAFTLDDSAAKDNHKEETEERREGVVFVDKKDIDGAALEPAVAKPSPRLSTLVTLLVILYSIQGCLMKDRGGRASTLGQSLPK